MYYSTKDYRLLGFEKSKVKNKKYNALLEKIGYITPIKVPFGDSRFEQFQDQTGLNLWQHKNHYDPKRRRLYRARHLKELREGYYSPGYFSYFYLW